MLNFAKFVLVTWWSIHILFFAVSSITPLLPSLSLSDASKDTNRSASENGSSLIRSNPFIYENFFDGFSRQTLTCLPSKFSVI